MFIDPSGPLRKVGREGFIERLHAADLNLEVLESEITELG
jgi:hypothetical protein